MLVNGLTVYRFKYVREGVGTRNDTQWSVNILAKGWDTAEAYLRSQVGPLRIEERSGSLNVDAIVPDCIPTPEPKIIERVVHRNISVPVTPKEDFVNVADKNKVICPLCEKEFKDNNRLQTHIKKFHVE